MTDGERWVRDQLERLRGDDFSPVAVATFVAASRRRAREVRRARPQLARRARHWEAAGLAAWALAAAAGRQPFRRRVGMGLAWWTATAVMLDWHLGMFESEDGRPRNLGAADALTLGRAWLVPVIADDLSPLALGLAAVTDATDGMVARATTPTRAGRDLEALVDAAVLMAALTAAQRRRRLHPLVVALELGRVIAGTTFAIGVSFARAQPPSATVLRAARLTTPVRMAGLMAAGTGRRGPGDLLVGAGSLASVALLAHAARERPA